MNLARATLRRPVTTLMAFLSLVVIGVIATRLIPMEYFPEVEAPYLGVMIPYPGSSPEEVERQITRPAEEVLATLPGIKTMRSTSGEDGANIWLEFDWGAETDLLALQVREKLDGVFDQFPSDVERYFVRQESSSEWPILNLRVSSDRDLSGAYELLDRKVKRRLERIEGVSSVELNGVEPKEIRIELRADRVAAHRVDLVQLSQTLRTANFSVTAGRISDTGRRYNVRPVGELRSVEQVRDLVVGPNGLRLSDIADVQFDDPVLDYGRHLDRAYAVAVEVKKEAGANTIAVTDRIMDELATLRDDPEMQGIALYEMDNMADGIQSSLRDLLESGLIGALFAIVVLYLFLRRVATTLIVTLSVPISLLITVGCLYFLGISLNVLSMMGLMLAVGMLVDNAVVVTESIHRHQGLRAGDPKGATVRGVQEVGLAVTAGTFTTAIVFLPMIVSPADEVTLYLKHVAITICVALVASLVLAQTVVPLLTSRLRIHAEGPSKTRFIDGLVRRYTRALRWMLGHPRSAGLIALVTLLSVMVPAQLVNQEFFDQESGTRQIRLFYHLDKTYTLERVEESVDRIEEYLYANQDSFDIESVYTWYTPNTAVSTILLNEEPLTPLTPEELQDRIRENLPKIAIGQPNFSWESPQARDESVRLTIHGESSARLATLSQELADLLGRVDGFKDVVSEARDGDEEIHVVVDRERARQYGFSTAQVAQTVSAGMRGMNLRRFNTPNGEVAMRLQFQGSDRATLDHLRNLPVQHEDGSSVALAALADFERHRGPSSIFRENRQTLIGVRAQLDGLTMDEARERLSQVMEQVQLPPGYGWGYGQSFRREEESQSIMMMNLLLALALIYLVMAALFESLIHPLAIWTSILYAIVGVFWFFFATGTTLSLMAWIGVLILIGVVVNNGIVLIDHINLLRSEGLDRTAAVLQGGRDRFRPIVMTAATTVLGLIPLCISKTLIGGDGPPYYPMARAIVGGLTFSTVITLLILPTIYVFLDDLRLWSRRIVRQARA